MTRWFAIPLGGYEPLLSPLSHEPYEFLADTKPDAIAYIARVWPSKLLAPQSVVEFTAERTMESSIRRFLASCDGDRARAIARDVAEEALLTGQGDLLACAGVWRERWAA